MAAITIGADAPDFTLPGSDGKEHSLHQYRGKFLVLFFYPKDDTPGCTKEACSFRDLHPELQSKNTVVLGVSPDGIQSHQKFSEKLTLPFVLLSDPDRVMMRTYAAWGEKNLYGKNVKGVLRSTVVIAPDGTIAHHWPLVRNAEQHPQKVAEFLTTAHMS